MNYFSSKFNMSEYETVALMGAHNPGLAMVDNSGYSGWWVEGQMGKLNNMYYRILVNNMNWTQV
jgi:hypothetical protein